MEPLSFLLTRAILCSVLCFLLNKFQVIVMGTFAHRKIGVLTYLGTNLVPQPTSRDRWRQSPMTKDPFLVMLDKMPLGTAILFESVDEKEPQIYQTLFEYHLGKEGIIVDSRSILRISIERAETSWSDLCFEFMTQNHQSRVRRMLAIIGVLAKI